MSAASGPIRLFVQYSLTGEKRNLCPLSCHHNKHKGMSDMQTKRLTTVLALGLGLAPLLALLLALIRRRLGGLDDRRLLVGTLKTAAASVVMGAAVWTFLGAAETASVIVRTAGGVIVGAGTFAVAAWLMRVEDLRSLTGLIGRKVLERR
jgi:hypothetical protein